MSLKELLKIRENSEKYGDCNEVDYDCINEDVKEAVLDFNKFFKTILKENSIMGLNDDDRKIIIEIMNKYNLEPVNRNISSYKHIFYVHKKIFGDFEK